MKILNYGSMNIDNVYSVEHMARPGETILATGRGVFCGGKGLNQSIALARAGATVYHAGAIGEDGEGLRQLWFCKAQAQQHATGTAAHGQGVFPAQAILQGGLPAHQQGGVFSGGVFQGSRHLVEFRLRLQ